MKQTEHQWSCLEETELERVLFWMPLNTHSQIKVIVSISYIKGNQRGRSLSRQTQGFPLTASGDIIDQSNAENRKQELRGRIWAYNKQIGLSGLLNAYKHHCQNEHEVADFLGVTDMFLKDALVYYKNKYGQYAQLDNYIIFFEPAVAVMELI
jgi:hypothetical protein